jgi:N-acetyl-anhydromuramyl-L-alanine amidase AmpD
VTYEIAWLGNEHTNQSSRNGRIPNAIVDHISAGTMASMDAWFRSPDNSVSSAHFGVSRDGRIHQYVDIRKMAWGNGAVIADYPVNVAQVVRDNYGVNPNLYTVSIEHEGIDGSLTEAQFAASVWLHGYIRDQIAEIYGKQAHFTLDAYHVIGHFQVSRKKPSCPGPLFPWQRLYTALAALDTELAELDTKEDDVMLNADVANTIIATYLSPEWFRCNEAMTAAKTESDVEAWRNLRDYQKWLADELRKASGQKT